MRHDANTPDIEVASGRNKTQLSLLIVNKISCYCNE